MTGGIGRDNSACCLGTSGSGYAAVGPDSSGGDLGVERLDRHTGGAKAKDDFTGPHCR